MLKHLKNELLPYLASASILTASTGITFSDSVDVLAGSPYTLDTSQYQNTIIGEESGQWGLLVHSSSTISNFGISHYIFLFGQGTLDTIRVYGTTSGTVNLIARPGQSQRTFLGSAGTEPNEYLFNLGGYDMAQGGETLFTGFDTMTKITFSGEYTNIPEPAASSLLFLASIAGLTLIRKSYINKRGCQQVHRRHSIPTV